MAQSGQVQPLLPTVTAASPEATAFARYGSYEVNMYTGLPNISIPLYEIKVGDIVVPISLSYHASGIKVTDPGSWVGLGWTLNVGGMITRKQMGKPDEQSGNYLRTNTVKLTSEIDDETQGGLDYLRDVYRGIKDVDPDIFSINIPGKSANFLFNQRDSYTPVFIPYQPWSLTKSFVGDYMTMQLVDDGGLLYKFDILENTTSCSGDCPTATSAWKPSRIFSANRKDSVVFKYFSRFGLTMNDVMDYQVFSDNINHFSTSCTLPPYTITPLQTYTRDITVTTDEKYVDTITFTNGMVVFERNGTDRTDINGSKILYAIKVYNQQPNTGSYALLKTIRFYQSYFATNQVAGQGRLKLDSVNTLDKTGAVIERYSFEYNSLTRGAGAINIRSRDYWGYYNAKNNDVLVPRMEIEWNSTPLTSPTTMWVGSSVANSREPDETNNQISMLKKIVFPTRGYTEFEFETNQYLSDAGVKYGGGLRVKKIKSYDGYSPIPIVKTYKYGENEAGYGRGNFILSKYFFTATQTNRFFSFEFPGPSQCATKRVRMFLSNSNVDLEGYDGAPVVYPVVTEYIGDETTNTGKTIYSYTDFTDALTSAMSAGKPIINTYHFQRGLLQNKRVFKNISGTYIPVSSTGHVYGAFGDQVISNIGIGAKKILVNDAGSSSDVDLGPFPNVDGYYDSDNYLYTTYALRTGDNRLIKTVDTLYHQDDISKIITNTTDFYYDNAANRQLTRTVTTNSLGQVVTLQKKYPHDFSGTAPYNTMISANIINPVVEEIKLIDGVQENKVKNNFNDWGNTNYLPQTIEMQVAGNTIETRASFASYNSKGNILELQKTNDVKKSYIWGYNNALPIAEVINAKSNEIFHSNFEEPGGWNANLTAYDNTKSRTGAYSGRIDKPTSGSQFSIYTNWLQVSLTGATKFKYSGWIYSSGTTCRIHVLAKRAGETAPSTYSDNILINNPGKWVYAEREWIVPADVVQLTMRIDNSGLGTVWFDDLRLYPANAQMTTYTYEPLVGITSVSDVNNRIISYEYDNYGRLMVLRDQDGNIIKTIEYKFKQ